MTEKEYDLTRKTILDGVKFLVASKKIDPNTNYYTAPTTPCTCVYENGLLKSDLCARCFGIRTKGYLLGIDNTVNSIIEDLYREPDDAEEN